MIPKLILLAAIFGFRWLIKRDIASRKGVSSAIWIPTLWVAIISSRPLSMWFAYGGGDNTMDGSPVDRLGFFILIGAAWFILSKRQVNWSSVITDNWAVFLFYGFLLLSVFWANSPFVSFKRWFKEFGNILMVIVILTEIDPQEALRAVFVRCGYVLLPLSEIFIRWFPELGRRYNIHNGEMEAIGVTGQKNSLGALVLVCGLILLWDWMERLRQPGAKWNRFDWCFPIVLLSLGGYLLHLCDSKTAVACLILGSFILVATRLSFFQKRIKTLGMCALAAGVLFFAFDYLFGIKQEIVQSMGRDMTFTGRTDVWRELLNLHTDSIIGVGFMSFWDDMEYRAKLPYWVAFSAHNGYLETYLAGGFLGVFFLGVMLLAVGLRINKSLSWGGNYSVVRLAIFVIVLLANYSESNFACMTPVGFIFLSAAIGDVEAGYLTKMATQSLGIGARTEGSEAELKMTEPVLF